MSTHDDAPDSVAGSTDSTQADSTETVSTQTDSTQAATMPQGPTEPLGSIPGSGTSTTGPAPVAPPAEPAPRARLRVATVVWGLVITAIGILVLATASGVSFDLGLVMIGLIGFAGIALLIGSIASGIRHRHP